MMVLGMQGESPAGVEDGEAMCRAGARLAHGYLYTKKQICIRGGSECFVFVFVVNVGPSIFSRL